MVAFPHRRVGTGLYAFVEAPSSVSERNLSDFVSEKLGSKIAPEHLQIVDALPRHQTGEVHKEVLQLIALNQLDLINPLITSEIERIAVAQIVACRRNMGDRRLG